MIKSIKKMMAVMAAVCLAGAFTACSSGDGDDPFKKPEVPFETEGAIGNVVTFNVIETSRPSSEEGNNKLVISLRRSEAGAKEALTLQDAKYKLMLPDGTVTEAKKNLQLSLNMYGSCPCFAEGEASSPAECKDSHYAENGTIIDSDNMMEFQNEDIKLNYDFKPGDVVKFQLISATLTGEGSSKKAELLPKIKVALIDGHKNAGGENHYYNVLFDKGDEGFPCVFKKDADVEEGEEVDAGLLSAPKDFIAWNNITLEADKFEGLTAGDKIVLTYVTNDEKDNDGYVYHQLKGESGADKVVVFETGDLTVTSTDATKVITLTGTNAKLIADNGVMIMGHGVNLKKLTIEKGDGKEPEGLKAPEAGDNILESAVTPDWGSNPLTIAAGKFENAAEGNAIEITIGTDSTEGTNQLKLTYSDWNDKFCKGTISGGVIENNSEPLQDKPGYTGAPEKEPGKYENTGYGRIDFNADTKTVTYVPTAAEWTTIKASGMIILGNGCQITSVKFVAVAE